MRKIFAALGLGAGLLLGGCAMPRSGAPGGRPPGPTGGGGESREAASIGPAVAKTVDVELSGDPTRVVLPPGHGPGWRGPALVFFHGHGMDERQLTERTGLALRAAQEGWIAASGLLGGRRHWSNQAALRAAGRLLEALPSRWGAAPDRLVVVGLSMGGATALLVAANPLELPYRVAAVACSQGAVDPTVLAAPFRQSLHEAYGRPAPPWYLPSTHDALAQAERLRDVPIYLEHGDADPVVSPGQTRHLAARFGALGIAVEVAFHPGRVHGEAAMDEAAIVAFLKRHVGPPGPSVMSLL